MSLLRWIPGSRNVALLALCQALAMTGNNILALTATLVAHSLLIDKSWASLPTALQMGATMLTVIPASLLMGRIGRRAGFTLGALIGASGAATAGLGIAYASFPLFCLGTTQLGLYQGFAAYYRFAAADTADPGFRGKAISWVLAGGVIAALFGPEIAKWSRNLFDPLIFAGCYLLIFSFCCMTILVLRFVDIAPIPPALAGTVRPIWQIMRQPAFYLAAAAGMIAYSTMSLVMTATPLAMLQCSLPFESTAFVIQWHALGMFAPSFVTGHLISRFGVLRILLVGVLLLVVCSAIALSGIAVAHFWAALTLLGVGWNFLYIGSSTLLTEAYAPAERAKTQAANDFLIFAAVTPAALSSGFLVTNYGWATIDLLMLPLAAIIFSLIMLRRRSQRLRAATAL